MEVIFSPEIDVKVLFGELIIIEGSFEEFIFWLRWGFIRSLIDHDCRSLMKFLKNYPLLLPIGKVENFQNSYRKIR